MYDLLKLNSILFAFGICSTASVSLWKTQMEFESLYPQSIDIKKNKIKSIDVYSFGYKDTTCFSTYSSFGFNQEGYRTYYGSEMSFASPMFHEAFYEYDPFGALSKETTLWNGEQNTQTYSTTYSKDKRKRTTVFEETYLYPQGYDMSELKKKNNIAKYATEVFDLGPQGKIIKHTRSDFSYPHGGNWYTYFTQDLSYDSKGHLIAITTKDTMKNTTWTYHQSSDYLKYNMNGNVSEYSEGDRHIRSADYSTDNPELLRTYNYYYDKNNRLIKRTYWQEGAEKPSVEEWKYDANGKLLQETTYYGETFTYKYNSRGLPTEKRSSKDGKHWIQVYKYYYKYYD